MWEIALCSVQMGLETWNNCITVRQILLKMWFVLCMWQCPTHFTDYNGAQPTPSSCWGQDDITHWTAVMEWWGEAPQLAALETLCVPLRRVGPLLPSLSLMSPPSKHGWGPPGRTRNIYRVGVVRELEVKWSTWWCRRKGVPWREEDWQDILSNQPTSALLVVVNPPSGPLLQHQLQSTVVDRVLQ